MCACHHFLQGDGDLRLQVSAVDDPRSAAPRGSNAEEHLEDVGDPAREVCSGTSV